MAIPPRSSLPLPPRWPLRVRSAAVHALSLARMVLTTVRSGLKSPDSVDLRIARLTEEVHLLNEELRLKDARMARIPAQRRPHFLPIERLAILELRATRGWSQAQTSDHMQVTPATVASWTKRMDEEGPGALVQMPVPVNRFPELVAYIVQKLKLLCPTMGKVKIANFLARAGLHLGSTTVARMLKSPPRPTASARAIRHRGLRSKRPNQIWHIDLTTVPTGCGFWIPWPPRALPQRWPFYWWVGVVVDHFSRRVMGFAIFRQNPMSMAVRRLLGRAVKDSGARPNHLITDQGKQFTDKRFRRWCRQRGIRKRFGAVQKYGSVSVVERFIRTMKSEALRRILIPFDQRSFRREVELFVSWYNQEKPHNSLEAATPDEVYSGRRPRSRQPRYEPRKNGLAARPALGLQPQCVDGQVSVSSWASVTCRA